MSSFHKLFALDEIISTARPHALPSVPVKVPRFPSPGWSRNAGKAPTPRPLPSTAEPLPEGTTTAPPTRLLETGRQLPESVRETRNPGTITPPVAAQGTRP